MPVYRLKPGQYHHLRPISKKGMTPKQRRGVVKVGPGETLILDEHRAKFIMDKLDLVGASEEEEALAKAITAEAGKHAPMVVAREDGEGYDVVNRGSGKPLNDKPLSQDDAQALAAA